MRYYLVAGEASGDLHGSALIGAIREQDPDAEFRFRGGALMQDAAGVPPAADYSSGAVMGPSDVLANARTLLRGLRACKRDILAWAPDAVILIDYPGFNLPLARFCHGKGFKVFYFIAPKTWASRESRNKALRKYIDRLFIIFPFEVDYFASRGVPAQYCGNPLIDLTDKHNFVRPCPERYIAVLPGSRKGEISRTMPVCMEVAETLGMQVLVAGAPSASIQDYEPYTAGHRNVKVIFGRTYDILKYADAAVINSGTASLEAAIIGTPQVVCWSTTPLTWWYAKKLLRVDRRIRFISLANLCLDTGIFKELIQDSFNKASVLQELHLLLDDKAYRGRMLDDYARLRLSLGGGGAVTRIAQVITEETKSNHI